MVSEELYWNAVLDVLFFDIEFHKIEKIRESERFLLFFF